MDIEIYKSISSAIVKLFAPLAEVVIHDIETDKIVYISGSLSKRQVGDDSLLGSSLEEVDMQPYTKRSFNERFVRSISIPIKQEGKAVALMCINCDISLFEQINTLLGKFLNKSLQSKPEALFKNDWQDRLNTAVHLFLQEKGWQFDQLNTKKKKTLARYLYDTGAFEEKKAPDYIAKHLNMGRATIFNYLREWRS